MSSIVGIDSITQQKATETLTGSSIMGKDDFLKMLTIQLQHQDPLNPMSNDQFATQLAQFTQIETLNNINSSIQTQILMNQSMNNSFMVNMIGKEVMSYGNTTMLSEGNSTMDFQIFGDAANVTIRIYDETGNEIATLKPGAMRSGDRKVSWDGIKQDGSVALDGVYTFKVEAIDKEGGNVFVETMNNGLVTGITYDGGIPYLLVNGNYVNLGDIVSINSQKE